MNGIDNGKLTDTLFYKLKLNDGELLDFRMSPTRVNTYCAEIKDLKSCEVFFIDFTINPDFDYTGWEDVIVDKFVDYLSRYRKEPFGKIATLHNGFEGQINIGTVA